MQAQEMRLFVEEYGGKRNNAFNQAVGLQKNWRELIPDSQGGVCGGLALMWLAANRHGMLGQVFGNKYSKGVFQYAEHASQLGADNSMGGAKGIEAVANTFSLKRVGAHVTVNNGNAAKWIVGGASSFVFIALGASQSKPSQAGHAAAVQINRPAVKFFEPNYGEFIFPKTLSFALFFPKYLEFDGYVAKRLSYFG
jgi:hypothetical protein